MQNNEFHVSVPSKILSLNIFSRMSSKGTSSNSSDNPHDQSYLKPTTEEDYGYTFFPDRSVTKDDLGKKPSIFSRIAGFVTSPIADHSNCEKNVIWCTQNDPLVKLMMGALKSKGCEVNLGRHISCEKCNERCSGGYDPITNQVVVCENNTVERPMVCAVLAHELTHAFDKCRAKLDFTDIEHLACTEVRASNFTHCSYTAATMNGEATFWDYKEAQQYCVKNKAMQSVMLVRNVTKEQAMIAVDKVFDQCYADLEPVGRIPRKRTRDYHLAYEEGKIHGYVGS